MHSLLSADSCRSTMTRMQDDRWSTSLHLRDVDVCCCCCYCGCLPRGIVWCEAILSLRTFRREWPSSLRWPSLHLYAQFKWHTQRRGARPTGRQSARTACPAVRPTHRDGTGTARHATARRRTEKFNHETFMRQTTATAARAR